MDAKIINGEQQTNIVFLLAHGAGAGIDTEFMAHIATEVAKRNICVIRFDIIKYNTVDVSSIIKQPVCF